MSAPKVDVRAVLDVRRHLGVKQSTKNANAAFLDWRDWCNYLPQADKARAAVAELIEAGNAWCALMPGLAGGPEFDRLVAALANVGGQP